MLHFPVHIRAQHTEFFFPCRLRTPLNDRLIFMKFTVKKGDKIKMIKIKPMKNVAKRPQGKYGEEKPINAYAYVKTKSGKKGWIYLSKKKSSWGRKMLFKKVPGWG